MRKNIYRVISLLTAMMQLLCGIAYADTQYLDGSKNISGWNVKAPADCYATCELTTVDAYSGNSLKWTKKSGAVSGVYAIMERNVAVKKDTTYRCELWAKAKSVNDVQFAVSYYNRQSLTPIGGTYDWMRLQFDYTHTSNDGSVAIQIILNGSVGSLMLDNIKFYEVKPDGSDGENMFADYDFDGGKTTAVSEYSEKKAYDKFIKDSSAGFDEYKTFIGNDGFLPVYKASNIAIDGDFSDWQSGYTGFTLPSEEGHVTKVKEWSDKSDCSGEFSFAYDDEYFYIYANITDDKYNIEGVSYTYEADSIQFNFSKKGTDYNYGFLIMNSPDGGVSEVCKGAAAGSADKIKLKTAQDGNNVLYEAAVPWDILFEKPMEDLTFDILINDNDGSGRAAFIQWKYGIGEGKGPEEFGQVKLLEDGEDSFAWFADFPDTVQKDEEIEAKICIANTSNNAKHFTYGSEGIDVPAKRVVCFDTAVSTDKVGVTAVEAVLNEGDNTVTARTIVTSERNIAEYQQDFSDFEKKNIPEIEKLIKECEEQGHSVDYENVSLAVMKEFVQYGISDAENDMKTRAEYVYEKLCSMYERVTADLNAYLSGEKTPKQVDKYEISDISTDGVSFIAKASDGEEKPVFFTGFGHFTQVVADLPVLNQIGANIIQIEIGPSNVVTRGGNGTFGVNTATIQSYILGALDKAEKNNVMVNVLLSPHYIPDWFKKDYPEASDASYFDSDPKMKEMLETYLRTIIPMIKDHPALHSVCLSNESTYVTANYPEHLPAYRDYLNDLYQNISALNANYGSSYSSFDVIPFPDTNLCYAADAEETIAQMPQYYDWVMFNNKFQADFHEWMYNIIQEEAPGLLATSKHMQTFDCDEREWRRNFINRGPDFEMLSEFLPINGNDANNYLRNTTWGILNKMSFYDLQTSLRRAPVFDLEDHVINDRSTNYSDEWQTHLESDIWQGTIHGRGATAYWVWNRTYDAGSDFAGSILHRPDVIDVSGRTMLDIARLSEELTSLETTPRNVGILYSNAGRIYSMYNNNALTKAYEAASYIGERIEFVTEKQAAEGKLEDCDVKLLIIPEISHVLTGAPEAIKKFIENGGRVVILGEDALSFNEYHKAVDADVRNYIMSNATVIPTQKDGGDQILSPSAEELQKVLLSEKKLCEDDIPVSVTDRATGADIYGVEYTAAEKDGKILVNLCNYEYDTLKYVDVRYEGTVVGALTELRSMTEADGGGIVLYPYHPILIEFDKNSLTLDRKEFSDMRGHWAETVVNDLRNEGIIAGISETEYAPARTVTAGEFAALAARTVGISDTELLEAIENRAADAQITREEMAAVVMAAYQSKKNQEIEADLKGWDDSESVKYKTEMAQAVRLGIIRGTDDSKLSPENTATRAEAAAVIKRLYAALEFDYTQSVQPIDTAGLDNINEVKIGG